MYILRSSARRKVEKKAEYHIPEEIVIDILGRLPAKDILRCQRVCRRWRDLTFNLLILAVDVWTPFGDTTFFLDKWWEIGRKSPVIYRYPRKHSIVFSLNGLIVSDQRLSAKSEDYSNKFLVYNPVTGEDVTITLSREIAGSDPVGLYFHPVLKEYCILWMILPIVWNWPVQPVEYKVLNLGSKPCWQKICNLPNRNPRITSIDPLFIDSKYLYWVVEAGEDGILMEFDIISQELKQMSCPLCFKAYKHNINLINMDGCLSLVQIIIRGKNLVDDINIWTLVDRVQQSWGYSNYGIDLEEFHFKVDVGFVKAICAANGGLAIELDRSLLHKSLLIYNFKRGTTRIMEEREKVEYYSHLLSCASLRNCKSNIHMDEKGEVPTRSSIKGKKFKRSNLKSSSDVGFKV